ncbi:hypothetical protein J6590_052900 [Homalodisca vitripennis]|nr:hypothetical protein J6590_052900 [Homalodisca vitripennis]
MVTSPHSLPPHPSLANNTDNSGWFSRTTRTTAHGSACDPSRYKWLPRHTHYLLIHHAYNSDNSAWFSAYPPVINGYLATLTTSHKSLA